MRLSNSTLAIVGIVVVLGLVVLGIARLAFDDADDETEAREPVTSSVSEAT